MNRGVYLPVGGFLLTACLLFGANPIVPAGVYIADPTGRVWPDGRLYVYGSQDESPEHYCSHSYRVLSSANARDWSVHGISFVSCGANDEVPYSDAILAAPDCMKFGNTYVLYYCLDAEKKLTEGVAISKSPTGPFTQGRVLDVGGINKIDPSVFIDDEGTAYYTWGQYWVNIAKLKPGGLELDIATIQKGALTAKEHKFHEGSFLIKRKGMYYLVYADISRKGRPTCLGYATSQSPFGPYQYRGVIIDNAQGDPATWNNHGSIVEFGGQWYVLYHRATHGSRSMRKACIEPITFLEDGSIPEVEMTTQGADGPLDARLPLEAARACLLRGHVRIEAIAPDREALCQIENGDVVAYKYLDFGKGVDRIAVETKASAIGASIEVALDESFADIVASLEIPVPGDGNTTARQTVDLNGSINGKHAVWLRFRIQGKPGLQVHSLQFLSAAP